MAKWFQIRVELFRGRGIAYDPPPGRIFIAGGTHSFGDLATSIDAAFGRWDLAHLHFFEFADGRRAGSPDPEHEDEAWLDETEMLLADELAPGVEFTYTFDATADWRHRCVVPDAYVNPRYDLGMVPLRPVAVWGWGSIPDQHGRINIDDPLNHG